MWCGLRKKPVMWRARQILHEHLHIWHAARRRVCVDTVSVRSTFWVGLRRPEPCRWICRQSSGAGASIYFNHNVVIVAVCVASVLACTATPLHPFWCIAYRVDLIAATRCHMGGHHYRWLCIFHCFLRRAQKWQEQSHRMMHVPCCWNAFTHTAHMKFDFPRSNVVLRIRNSVAVYACVARLAPFRNRCCVAMKCVAYTNSIHFWPSWLNENWKFVADFVLYMHNVMLCM